VVGGTLAKHSNLKAENIIQRLSSNQGEILRLEGNTLELCISASFDLLPNRLQTMFLALSVFPGAFEGKFLCFFFCTLF